MRKRGGIPPLLTSRSSGLTSPVADPIIIASIVGSALVAPSVVAAYALFRQRAEFGETRRRELCELLEQGAQVITQALRAHEDMPWEWSVGVVPPQDRAVEIVAARRATIERVRHVEDRLLIRLPEDHSVVSAFDAATGALDAFKRSTAPTKPVETGCHTATPSTPLAKPPWMPDAPTWLLPARSRGRRGEPPSPARRLSLPQGILGPITNAPAPAGSLPQEAAERREPATEGGFPKYRHGDSNPGFRRERAAS